MKFKKMSKLRQFAIQIFVNCIKPFLQLFFREFADWVMSGIVVYVRQQDSLRKWWLDMLPRASVAMTACSYLDIPLGKGNQTRNQTERTL